MPELIKKSPLLIWSDNGGSPTDPSGGGTANIFLRAGEADGRSFTVGYICNLAGVQHGVITDSTNAGSEGAGTAIDRNSAYGGGKIHQESQN